MAAIKKIIFDYDETLVGSKVTIFRAIKSTGLKFYGLEITDDDINNHWGVPFKEFLARIFKVNESEVDKLVDLYVAEVMDFGYDFYPEVEKGLFRLKENFDIGILSSGESWLIRKFFELKDFSPKNFDYIIGSKESKFHKPNPKVFDEIIEIEKQNEVSKSEIVYIGDSPDDYEAASKAGISFLGIDHNKKNTFEKINIQYFFSFAKLVDHLIKLKPNEKQ